jgi:hypothetical protein
MRVMKKRQRPSLWVRNGVRYRMVRLGPPSSEAMTALYKSLIDGFSEMTRSAVFPRMERQ